MKKYILIALCFIFSNQSCFATLLQELNIVSTTHSEALITNDIHFKDLECRMIKCMRCGKEHDSRKACPK